MARARMRLLAMGLLSATLLAAPACAQTGDDAIGPGVTRAPLPATAGPHRLTYTAHEATWSHLALSPDGQVIWFDLLGDIYRMPITGGAATPVLTGPAFERNPVPSPDGQWIAFISDRSGATNLWVARPDGREARQITHDTSLVLYTSPAWAPDGKSLYISRAVHSVLAFELWRVPFDGGAGTLLVTPQPKGDEGWDERFNALGAAPSPDGQSVYYAFKLGHTWTEKDPPNWSIQRQDLATGATETIIAEGMRPVLSPDGRYLAYALRRDGGETGLRLRDLTTGDDRWLAWPIDHDGEEGAYYIDLTPRFQFTPDGKAIILSRKGGFVRLDVASGAQTPIPFSAPVDLALQPNTRVVQRVEDGPAVRSHLAEAAASSPDGRTIAFAALGGIYVAQAQGAPRRLFEGNAFQPAWSADGQKLAFVRWSARDGGGIWQMSAHGGPAHPFGPQGAFWSEPRFDNQGPDLLALRASQRDRMTTQQEIAPAWNVEVVRLSSDGAVHVLAHGNGLKNLQQTADGRIWVQTPGGLAQVAHGALSPRATVLARSPSQYVKPQVPVDELRLSSDGQWLAARTAYELHLVPMPAPGAAPVNLETHPAGTKQITRIGADTMRWEGDGLSWTVGSQWRHLPLARLRAEADPEAAAPARDLSVTLPRALPAGPQLLRGATVLTMEGGKAIPDADLLIVGDRIAAIGARGSLTLPRGTTIRDETGKFIMPGLVDTHAHFFGLRRPIHDDQEWEFQANLAYGVTSSLEVQAFTPDIFAYGDRIDAGLSVGPRLFSTGPGVFGNSRITSQQVAEDVLRRYRDAYRTRNIKNYMTGDRQVRQWVAQAARKLGMMPTTEGAADYVLELTHAIDGFSGNEHDLPITPLHEDVLRLFAASGISYNPTLTVLYGGPALLMRDIQKERPEDDARLRRFIPADVLAAKLRDRHWVPDEWQTYTRFAADAMRLRRAGALVGVGSHGEIQGLGLHWEMEGLVAGGATPEEALEMATIDNAKIMGRPADLGSLTPGKLADLLVLDADPRADIRNARRIALVMRGGIGFDPATLTRLDTGARLPAPWWLADAPPPARP